MAEVIVIGAGVGGLSASIDLATRGHDVTVLEAGPEAGGKLGRAVVDGAEFDTGPSVLTMVDVLEDLFTSAGTRLDAELQLVRHERVFEYHWPDGTELPVFFEPRQTLESVRAELGTRASEQLAGFLTYASDIWRAAAPAFVYGDAPGFRTLVGFGTSIVGKLRDIDPTRTMNAAIEAHVDEPHLRDLLRRYATYNGSDPWQAPATLNCIAHVEMALGSYGVRGGMYELAKALQRTAERAGVGFRFDARVDRILRATGGVTGVEVGGESHRADAVVANADAAHVFGDLLPDEKPQDAEPSMSGWTAVVRTARRARPPHAVLFPAPYRQEFTDIFVERRAPRDPTVYACAQRPAHERPGWADAEPLFLMANAPATGEGTTDATRLRQAVLNRAAEIGWIDRDDEVVWERAPADLARRFPGSDGAIYGASSNSRFAAFRRPPNRVASIRGLYLASGSAHPGGGVPLAILSGRAAARALSEDFAR